MKTVNGFFNTRQNFLSRFALAPGNKNGGIFRLTPPPIAGFSSRQCLREKTRRDGPLRYLGLLLLGVGISRRKSGKLSGLLCAQAVHDARYDAPNQRLRDFDRLVERAEGTTQIVAQRQLVARQNLHATEIAGLRLRITVNPVWHNPPLSIPQYHARIKGKIKMAGRNGALGPSLTGS